MRNVLSYVNATAVFSGKEIKDWINHQVSNHTSHEKVAKKMSRYNNLVDTAMYRIVLWDNSTSVGESRKEYYAVRA